MARRAVGARLRIPACLSLPERTREMKTRKTMSEDLLLAAVEKGGLFATVDEAWAKRPPRMGRKVGLFKVKPPGGGEAVYCWAASEWDAIMVAAIGAGWRSERVE